MTRFGLQLPNFTLGVPDGELFETFAGIAVAGEESGFDSLWVMDHFYQLPALGGAEQPMLEAYTVLGALAARTSRARPRHARDRCDLPEPGDAGQDRHDARRHQRWPRDPRDRRSVA